MMQDIQTCACPVGDVCFAESGTALWLEAPTLNWTNASSLGLVSSHHIAACESLLETYFMQVLG